jgi:hypothetical protein
MTYRPLNIECAAPGCNRPAEKGMWQETAGTRHYYCWLHYRDLIERERRAD